MNGVVSGATPRGRPEVMRHHEGFVLVPRNSALGELQRSVV